MAETVVHVTTLEQWKSVLDVWFEQGYKWNFGSKSYHEEYFERGQRFIRLISNGRILQGRFNHTFKPVEYLEFMAQQKEDNKMSTYYVTQEQLDLIKDLKEGDWPLSRLVNSQNIFRPLNEGLKMIEEKALLRYLGGDETIEFKVKEQLYRLVGVNKLGQVVYFDKTSILLPATISKEQAFTAPLEEIKKWKTPAWEIEKVQHGE